MMVRNNDNKRHPLPVYCHEAQYVSSLMKLLERSFAPTRCRSWREFLSFSERAQCCVVEYESLTHPQSFRQVFCFCSYPTLRPVVLVTQLTAANAKALKDLCIDELVWLSEMERELTDAIKRAMEQSIFTLISRDIQRSERLPAHLGRALTAICTSPFTVRSQKELAQLAQCDRSTLIRQWNRAMGDGTTLKDMIDWLLLLKAYSLHRGGRNWAWVAKRLEVDRRMLSALAKRLTGRPLKHLSQDQALAQFQRAILSRF